MESRREYKFVTDSYNLLRAMCAVSIPSVVCNEINICVSASILARTAKGV